MQRIIASFLHKKKIVIQIPIVIIFIFSLSGCMALLEAGELGELASGVEVSDLGTLRVINTELVADEISQVKLLNDGELSIIKNGRLTKFAELTDNNNIILENGRVVKLPGTLYLVNEDVLVRNSPFNNSSFINSEHYATGRLVIVNDEVNGWFEVMLPDHQFGFIPIAALTIAHPNNKRTSKRIIIHHPGFQNGVNYITNNAFINTQNRKELIVNVNFEDNSFDEVSSLKINSIAIENGYNSTPAFFSKNYYTDQLSKQLIVGNLTIIQKLKLIQHADYLLIGSNTIKIRVNQIQKDMLTSDLNYTLILINLKDGAIEKSWINTIHGNGWTDDQARNDVMQSFVQIIKQSKF